MENKSHALIAGLFIIALTIALVLAVLWFDRDTRERVPYELVTQASVAGLSPESSVRYRGLNVGKVEEIRFDPEVPGQILVDIMVDKGTPITHSTFATLGYIGVTGLAYVQFDDKGQSKQLLETTPDHVARIQIQPGLYDKLAGKSESLMLQVETIATRLNALLAPENQRQLTHALTSLDEATTRLGSIPQQLEPTLAGLPHLVDDSRKALATFDSTAQDFSSVAKRLQREGGAIERLESSLDRFDAAAGSLSTTTAGLDSMTATMNNETLPRIGRLAEEWGRSARTLDRTAETLGENPQSLIVGEPKIQPGPGEQGYKR